MSEDIASITSNAEDFMKKAIGHLEAELVKIRAGKANPQMFDGLMVDYYGSPVPVNQVSNISVMDARTLSPGKKICSNPLKELLSQRIWELLLRMMVS